MYKKIYDTLSIPGSQACDLIVYVQFEVTTNY